ncbi:MAG TPA: hypothetical protein PKM70_10170, partial [Clostridia bacterium]|nr:hypothetical protein [Clostridia bacterium]
NAIDVYQAVDMCIPGILAYRSILNGNAPQEVPNLRLKDERDKYRNDDTRYLVSNEDIPNSVFEMVRQKWIKGEPG